MVVELEKIVYEVKAEGASETAKDFRRVKVELDRLLEVQRKAAAEKKPYLFTHELAKSIDWLMPKMGKCATELGGLEGKYLAVAHAIGKNANEARKIARRTEDVTIETRKAGKAFGFGWKKLVKFTGAIGLGIYSMYTLANAVRRGFRAVKDFIKGGIDLALKKHKQFAVVIDRNVNRKLAELKTMLGEQLLPVLADVAVGIGEILDELRETGVITKFGSALSTVLKNAAGFALAFYDGLKTVFKGIERIIDETNRFAKTPLGKIIFYGVEPSAIVGGVGEAAGAYGRYYEKRVGGAGRGQAAATEAQMHSYLAAYKRGHPGPFPDEFYEYFDLEKPKEGRGAGRRPADTSLKVYRESRARLEAAEEVRELQTYVPAGMAEGFRETRRRIKEQQKFGEKLQVDFEAKVKAEAMKKAEVHAAYVKTLTQGIVSAARSPDAETAFKNLAINFAINTATMLATELIKQQIFKSLTSWLPIPGAQETAHIPGNVSEMLIRAHADEYILKGAQLKALQAGYGIEGGEGAFHYKVPPAPPNVNVDVHVAPGMDADIQTAYRARAGEARLEQLEG